MWLGELLVQQDNTTNNTLLQRAAEMKRHAEIEISEFATVPEHLHSKVKQPKEIVAQSNISLHSVT